MNLLKAVEELETCSSVSELWDKASNTLASVGIEFLIYLTVTDDFKQPFALTNLPELFGQTPPSEDPFLEYCCHTYEITLTGPAYLTTYDYLPPEAKAFISSARRTGFETGLGVPMRLQGSNRFGGFNLGTRFDIPDFENRILPHKEEIRFFCLILHRKIEELSQGGPDFAQDHFRALLVAPSMEVTSDLTPREREVVYHIAQGLSRKDCARILGISPNTVAEYTKGAYRKLNVSSRTEAARKLNGT